MQLVVSKLQSHYERSSELGVKPTEILESVLKLQRVVLGDEKLQSMALDQDPDEVEASSFYHHETRSKAQIVWQYASIERWNLILVSTFPFVMFPVSRAVRLASMCRGCFHHCFGCGHTTGVRTSWATYSPA
jgi:hypothetical protein